MCLFFSFHPSGVHLESSSVNHPELCERHSTQPLVYVLAFDRGKK